MKNNIRKTSFLGNKIMYFISIFLRRLWNKFKEVWPSLLIEVVIGGIVVWLITSYVADSLKERTDIDATCNIEKREDGLGNSLKITFNNKADFAGKNLYVYVWDLNSSSWGSDYWVAEQCQRIQKDSVDSRGRFKIFCDFIPPKTRSPFTIYGDLTENIIKTHNIVLESWGETTPYKQQTLTCD